jgi:hippurate hydrolase
MTFTSAVDLAKAHRAHLHAHPELSFEEYKTALYVEQELNKLGIDCKRLCDTGVIATVQGRNPDKIVRAIRADLDALPITEQNDVVYKSQNEGVMHACGHDFHTACLLGVAAYLSTHKDEWEGSVKLIFQPGEEKDPGGASLLIKAGVLENPRVDEIYAIHAYPPLPVGKIGTRAGTYMASADEIYITIKGKGGHAATPHLCIDPIMIAAQVLTQLQTIVSRTRNPIDPTVLTFGKISGGTKGNIIPEKVELEGTLRCMNEEWRMQCFDLITRHTELIARSMGGDAEVKILKGYPCVVNDTQLTSEVNNSLDKLTQYERVDLPLRMTADDFSFYTHHIPGCYIRIGTASKDGKQFTSSVHTPTFDIDQDAIEVGIATLIQICKD